MTWPAEREKKEVMVAIRVWEEEEMGGREVEVEGREEEEEEVSSERVEGVRRDTWPYRRPSIGPGEVENRWIKEARVGPDIAIFSMGRSSMALRERERERVKDLTREKAKGILVSCMLKFGMTCSMYFVFTITQSMK